MTLQIVPGTSTADFPDRWIDGDGIKWVESLPQNNKVSPIRHLPLGSEVEGVKMDFGLIRNAFPGKLEPCFEWNGGVGKGKLILLNPSLVIKVQRLSEKHYEVHFTDGDKLKLSELPTGLTNRMRS